VANDYTTLQGDIDKNENKKLFLLFPTVRDRFLW